jgi:hypothetical protein
MALTFCMAFHGDLVQNRLLVLNKRLNDGAIFRIRPPKPRSSVTIGEAQ